MLVCLVPHYGHGKAMRIKIYSGDLRGDYADFAPMKISRYTVWCGLFIVWSIYSLTPDLTSLD